METTFQYMRFVPYSAIHNWSVQFMSGTNLFASKYPIVQLGKYIKEENRRFDISDASSKYGILGVNNQTGIFDAYIESGANIKQKYKKIETGWIAFNPYRINVGSVGIKKECHSNDYISPAYVVFSCKRPLMADFLYLVMRTKTYNAVIRKNTTGSVRQSLSFKKLETLQIPLPDREEQNRLVYDYNLKIKESFLLIDEAEKKMSDFEKEISNWLGEEINVSKDIVTTSNKFRFLQLFHSRRMYRWDVWNIDNTIRTSQYDEIPLNQLIALQSGQFLPSKSQTGGDYIVYGGNGETGRHKEYCYSGKRIVIGRVGEYCGNVHLIDGHYWITDNAFKVDKTSNVVSWEYLAIALTNLKLNRYRSISAQPSISQKRILQLSIPVPPKEVQAEIVAYAKAAKGHIRKLQAKAGALKVKALQGFENALFKKQ